MVDRLFPGINFPSPQSYDNLSFEQSVYTDEILERFKLVFASSLKLSQPWYGIVAAEDPSLAQETEVLPLVVKLNDSDPTKIDVLPGIAVTPSGHRIVIDSRVLGVDLAVTTIGGVNIVYLEYNTTPSAARAVNHWNVDVAVKRLQQSTSAYVKVLTASDYAALSDVVKQHCIPLAVINMMPLDTGGTQAIIDMSRVNYAFIRPWFSPVDIGHRSKLGSGVQTDQNIHALTLNQLAATLGLALYEIEVAVGIILSKDVSVAGVPGYLCTEEIPYGSLKVDSVGYVTGTPGTKYAELSAPPVAIGRVCPSGIEYEYSEYDLAYQWIPQTNIIFFPLTDFDGDETDLNDPGWTGRGVKVWYTRANIGEMSKWRGGHTLKVGQGTSKEAAITSGGAYKTLGDEELDFADAGPVPIKFFVYVAKDGSVQKLPQILLPWTALLDLATPATVSVTPVGPCRVMIALTMAPTDPLLDVQLTVVGRDTNDQSQTEVVKFDGTYADIIVPYAPWVNVGNLLDVDSRQRAFTTKIFSRVDSVQVSSAVNAGPDASVIVYAVVDTRNAESLRGICPLAEVFWDGYRIAGIKDIRKIRNTLEANDAHFEYTQAMAAALQAEYPGTGTLYTVVSENFECPKLHNLCEERVDNHACTSTYFTNYLFDSNGTDPQLVQVTTVLPDAFPLPASYYIGRYILVRPRDLSVTDLPWIQPYDIRRIIAKIDNNTIEHDGLPFPPADVMGTHIVELLDRDAAEYPLHLQQRNSGGFGLYVSKTFPVINPMIGPPIGADVFNFILSPGFHSVPSAIIPFQLPFMTGKHNIVTDYNLTPQSSWRLEARFRLVTNQNKMMTGWVPVLDPALHRLVIDLEDVFGPAKIANAMQFRVYSHYGYAPRAVIMLARKKP